MEPTTIATSAYRHDDEDNNEDQEEPLLIASLMKSSLTYTKLFHWMKRIRFDNDDDTKKTNIDTSSPTSTTANTTDTTENSTTSTRIPIIQSILNTMTSVLPVTSTTSPSNKKLKRNVDIQNTQQNKQFLPNELIVRILEYITIQRVKHENVTAILCSSSDSKTFPLSSILDDSETSWWISASPTREQIEQQRLLGGLETKKGEYVEFSFIPSSLSNHNNNNNNKQSMYRLTTISMKIPPMPIGPCSVAEFHLERRVENNNKKNDEEEEEWYQFSPQYEVENRVGYQSFPVYDTFYIDDVNRSSSSNNDDDPLNDDDKNNNNVDNDDLIVVPFERATKYVDIDRIRVVCTKNQLYRMMFDTYERPPGAVGEVRTTHNLDEFSQVGCYSIRFD